ncbi:very low-density lipoprotein receptor-like isoform X2 [Rhinichthys klamathensis goyatoka]|uniref:very low-density lipoprotein receptor-like isoform X2 n=1 Tax=Rhinichthys klamathensis goyatoka TaxID=3034132 RepID=UPI0024B483D9|nr:very low-density lipoprotein receptor-like isoform X2 [Rhinichthys klamathensis goyatoka]
MRWRCDGDQDCLNGVDEKGCVSQDEDVPVTGKNQTVQNEEFKTYRSSHFSCGDERKSRVPIIWRCDGEKDCPNNADEEGCVVKTCSPTEFSCGDKLKTCLPMRWRCDGDQDCLNGVDEKGCVSQDEDVPVTSKNQTVQNEEFKTYRSSHFSCGDERKSRLPIIWRCDGEKDCPNNADEEGCVVKTCSPTEFSCGDKRKTCLPMRWRCDGDMDCLNGVDEEGCVVKTCSPTEFSCGDKRKTCLPMRWRCDGDMDCLNGVDEKGCVTQHEDAPVTSKNRTVQNEGKQYSARESFTTNSVSVTP